jgi:hypothetical protein
MDELSRLASILPAGGPAALERTLELSRALHDALTDQIALEDRILLPALREADAWGGVRADRLIKRHLVRHQELTALRISCAKAPGDFAGAIERFIVDRRADMRHAERHVLILRDDIVGIDVEGG